VQLSCAPGALYSQQRFEEAAASAERAEHGFAHIGER